MADHSTAMTTEMPHRRALHQRLVAGVIQALHRELGDLMNEARLLTDRATAVSQ